MKKIISIALFTLLLGFTHPLRSYAAETHTEAQEQQERAEQGASSSGQPSQTREQIEAAEKALLGEEAYQKLEVGHVLVESNPVLSWSIISAVILLLVFGILYFVRKRKNRA